MPRTLHLALAATLLLPEAAPARAQIHSPQVTIHRRPAAEDLSWLLQYADPAPDGQENKLARDPRFRAFLKQHLTAPQGFWGHDNKPLPEVAMEFLGGVPGRVIIDSNRYVSADACVVHFCPSRGLLWVDSGLPRPLVIFSAIDWISDNRATDEKGAAYSMWVFPDRSLDPEHIPAAFTRSIARWTSEPSSGSTDLQNIARVFLVDPDGTPHPVSPAGIGAHNTLPPETFTGMQIEAHP